jgi:eukaryotic-like serine/threonine-protein kinase
MNPERWQAVGDLFEMAVALPSGERTALIGEVSGNDDELRHEVVSLLASHAAAAGGFFQEQIRNALAVFAETGVSGAPARVGPYRLIRELGKGGMGTVFLAERDDEVYHARVAVKLVRPGMDTEFILARFRRERQTLARLEHQNISRLLDGGTTENGLPYIVMEYIDGLRLTAFAEDRRLTIDARLRMFLDVCSAVDYAHRNFIIHRDLKPGNILVSVDGVPKLLDFGICKLLHSGPVADGETVMLPMTPNYASPEQVRGDPATPLSDVYSLGAVLYELLTGTCPRHYEKLTPEAIERTSRTPIQWPSDAAKNATAARQLTGDLDNIVMRALESEPERRYQSAAELADDLRRYLDHEPVRARAQTMRYRVVKFVRRHRVPVAAAAAVFIAVSGGLGASMYQARIAESRLEQIRTLADKLVFDVHDAVRDLPGSTPARKLIVQTALEFLDSSVNSVRGDPRAEAELARAYRRLGDVQGYVHSANLGDSSSAHVSYRQAAALLDDALARAPGSLALVTERLVVYGRLGTLHGHTGRLRDAVQTLEQGIRAATSFVSAGDPGVTTALADLYIGSSEAKRNLSDYRGARQDAVEAMRLYRDVVTVRSSDPAMRHSLSAALAAVGMAEANLNQLQEALPHFREGADELEKLVAADPQNVTWNRDLLLAYGHIADVLGNPGLQNLGDRGGALHAYRRAAEIAKILYEGDRSDQRAAADYGIVLSRVETVMDDSDPAAKLAVQRQSLRVLDEAAKINPGNVSLRIYEALVNQHLGDTFAASADLRSAHEAYLRSAAVAEANMKSEHASLLILFIESCRKLALNAVSQGRRAEALGHARRALRAAEEQPSRSTRSIPRGLSAMGLTYEALLQSRVSEREDREQSLSWLTKSRDAWRASQSEPGFGAPHRKEMNDVEEALFRVARYK